MATTTTRTTADGVTTEELIPDPTPAQAPPPRVATIVLDIPETDDHVGAALTVLKKLHPDALSSTQERASAARSELVALIEHARLHESTKLADFIGRASQKIRLRNHLDGRADQLEGKPGTQPVQPGRRDPLDDRRDPSLGRPRHPAPPRARLVGAADRELADRTVQLKSQLPSTIRESHGHDPSEGHGLSGLTDSLDNWIRHYAEAHARRNALRNQLAGLGRDKRATAKDVGSAIAMVGTPGVIAMIAPAMYADAAAVARTRATLARLAGELDAVDPRTEHWKDLDAQRAKAEVVLARALQSAADARGEAASRMVAKALEGGLDDIPALEQEVSASPALAAALAECRGDARELLAVVVVMLEEQDGKAQAEIDRKAASQPRRP